MGEIELSVRRAGPRDVNLIAALGVTTCYEAYYELDPSHDLADYCARFFDPKVVADEVADENCTHLIVESRGNAIGFAKLREGNVIECVAGMSAIELQRIYVLEREKGRGIGRMLLNAACDVGREKGYEMLWLGVWDRNTAAQRFYDSIGMRRIGTTDFTDGKSLFLNYVYATEL
jgi:ribosomal protein S18 acetylase RimI-like enzyme